VTCPFCLFALCCGVYTIKVFKGSVLPELGFPLRKRWQVCFFQSLAFFLGIKYLFFTTKQRHVLCTSTQYTYMPMLRATTSCMPTYIFIHIYSVHVMHVHVIHVYAMHAYAVHFIFFFRINTPRCQTGNSLYRERLGMPLN
jgi:hypothetical protein